MPVAITRKMLRKETWKDKMMQWLMEDISKGECRPALHQFKNIFEELS